MRDIRLWAGIALLIVCSLVGRATIHSASARSSALVVVNNLARGSIIRSQDIGAVQVSVPDTEVLVSEAAQVVGKRARTDVFAGEVLTTYDLVEPEKQSMRDVAVPLRAGHVPALAYGDQVDVWVTPSSTGLAVPGPAHLIAAKVLVSVPPDVADSTTDTSITLSVPAPEVQALVQASQDGFIDVVAVPFADSQARAS